MTGEGVPKLPASLDCSDEPDPQAWGLARAIEHAWFSRNKEEAFRLAWQAERQIALMRAEIDRLNRAGPAVEAARVVDPERGQRTGSPAGEVR
jgi:hypothetical protein